MAPRGSKGKATDRSTAWSDFEWDERGYWIASRLDASGKTEYDYRYPEGAQTPENRQNTPRSPGPNVINNTDIYYAPITSTTDTSYGAYSAETNASYITSSESVSGYGKVPGYNVDPTSHAGGALQALSEYVPSDTESEATVRHATPTGNPPYAPKLSYSTVPQAYPTTIATAEVMQAFDGMAIAGPSSRSTRAPYFLPTVLLNATDLT
jgi:hypothetical protein